MTAFALPFVALLAWSVPSYYSQRAARRWRVKLGLLLLFGVMSLPWALPSDAYFTRFLCVLFVLLAAARIMETALGHAPVIAQRDFAKFALYYFCVGHVTFTEDPQERQRQRDLGWRRLGRAALKAWAVVGCFALQSVWPELHQGFIAHWLWFLFTAYWAASGAVDIMNSVPMLLWGQGVGEVFRVPPLATSPRDFWGNRWNMMFRNTAHRLIFLPLNGPRRPFWATSAVFLLSALVHEYLVVATLGYSRGHMFAFFMLHGMATLLCSLRRWPKMPRPSAIVLHLMWLVLTAPLFFTPLMEILPAQHWRLW